MTPKTPTEFAHVLEELLKLLSAPELAVNEEAVDMLRESVEALRAMLAVSEPSH